MKRVVISDIHGCSKTFRMMVRQILNLASGDHLFLLGDLIDRGPDTKGVLDEVFYLREQGIQVHGFLGNHEWLFLKAFEDQKRLDFWMDCGGREVLESFGIDHISDIPDHYIDLIDKLKLFHVDRDHILVHAGLNFEIPDPLSDEHAMLWIRNMDINKQWLGNKSIVHGHTPKPHYDIVKQKGPEFCIDGGCVFTDRPGLGHLIAFDLDHHTFSVLPNQE